MHLSNNRLNTFSEMKFNPTFKSAIIAGDTLIALGESSKLKNLELLAS